MKPKITIEIDATASDLWVIDAWFITCRDENPGAVPEAVKRLHLALLREAVLQTDRERVNV